MKRGKELGYRKGAEGTGLKKDGEEPRKCAMVPWDYTQTKEGAWLGNTLRAALPVAGAVGGAALGHGVGEHLGGEVADAYSQHSLNPEAFQGAAADHAASQLGLEPSEVSRSIMSIPAEAGMVDLEPARQQAVQHAMQTGAGMGGVAGAAGGGLAGYGAGKAVADETRPQPQFVPQPMGNHYA